MGSKRTLDFMLENKVKYYSYFKLIFSWTALIIFFSEVNAQNIVVSPYLQNLGQEEVTIMWETDVDVTASVRWGNDPFSLDQTAASSTIVGSGSSRIHTALLLGLEAGEKYYYRVELNGVIQS